MLDILREKITDNVFLYHAQYIFPDRMDKEEKLIKKVGKDSTEKERSGLVVVGSQVLEQSLDLDFDLLITDLCPMDLLLQRIGRLHRHEKHDSMRPESAKAARCLVLGADTSEFEEGAKTIYGEWLLARTKDFLPEKVMIPDDISVLVQKVYRELKPIEREQEYYEEYCRVKKSKENRAGGFLLNKAKSKRDIHGLLDAGITDANAEASVRDGISSIEVIVMIRNKDELFFLPWQNEGAKVSDADILDTSI